MEMKLCPYCGKSIVKDALACKHCGQWLEDISGYLEQKGSIYAHTDSIELPQGNPSPDKYSKNKKITCVFCGEPANPGENEIKEKSFVCLKCGKKNILTNGHSEDVLKNVPLGWGWILLAGYFIFAIQSYLNILDDNLQVILTFSLSVAFVLIIYFIVRRFILMERYEKKKFFGNIYDASIISGTVSTAGVILFIFVFHFAYPLTGLQSDRKETDSKISYYQSKIDELTQKQNEIYNIISEPPANKKDKQNYVSRIDELIHLKNDEKKYSDSIYILLVQSNFYSGDKINQKKIKEASLLMNKINSFKIMSAQNLKNYYLYGEKNSLKTIDELDKEIEDLNKLYVKNYQNLMEGE